MKTAKKPKKSANPAKKGARRTARKSSTAGSRKKPSRPARNRQAHQRGGPEKNPGGRGGRKTKTPEGRELTEKEQQVLILLRRIQSGEIIPVEQGDLDRIAKAALAAGVVAGLIGGIYLGRMLFAE